MNIAVIGSGISGLTAALIAQKNGHKVTLFEKNSYFGGHSNTIDFKNKSSTFPVDTGFLVHNRITYPTLIALFEYLEVPTVESDMTLSIKNTVDRIEWGGENLKTVFAQKKNLFNFRFYRFLLEILKFNRNAKVYLEACQKQQNLTLGELLDQQNYSKEIKDWYLVPMAAAIWSTPADKILDFPAWTFLRFCLNHHLLQVNDRPKWRTIPGGSRIYVQKIVDQITEKHLNVKIEKIVRAKNKFEVVINGIGQTFDIGILAAHPQQSLQLLDDPTEEERKILSLFEYQPNRAYVHQDTKLLPERKSLWAAWNYLSSPQQTEPLCVSYLINRLQPLPTNSPVIVSLNPDDSSINQKLIKMKIEYEHPIFNTKTISAQSQLNQIQGKKDTFYAGAWQGYGFHEDGAASAVRIAKTLGWKIPWE